LEESTNEFGEIFRRAIPCPHSRAALRLLDYACVPAAFLCAALLQRCTLRGAGDFDFVLFFQPLDILYCDVYKKNLL
jgi:hypothetical protein